MTLAIALMIGGGLAGLVVAAHWLVEGAARLGQRLGISAIIIGLTMVAFGTSAPELAVSLKAAFSDSADIAVGNIVGSNIFNILLILGLSAVILPLAVHADVLKRDLPLMIGVAALAWFMAMDGRISTFDGLLLSAILAAYLGWLVVAVRKGRAQLDPEAQAAAQKQPRALWIDLLSVVAGISGLVLAADWLVTGSVELARLLGVSELVIGLTIVSLGTSLPELATSLMAAIKGERDIAVGNIVGSNLFNILSVLGLTALIAPGGLLISAQAIALDFPVMVAVSLLCVPVFFIGLRISRADGVMMLLLLAGYLGVLVALARDTVFSTAAVGQMAGAVALFVLLVQGASALRARASE
jgi:cation:H+ antiporter